MLVALRKESVDRNKRAICRIKIRIESLSARRAWIEMRMTRRQCRVASVALRKESVDRNPNSIRRLVMSVGRSPQGERG